MLEPGRSYLITYHVRPVVLSGSASMPTASTSISYVDGAGATKSILEAPRLPLIRDRFIRKRMFFTMPAGNAPFVSKVFFSVYSYAIPDDHIIVDEVSLVQMDENEFPKYGYYAWIRNLDEKLYTEPGGKATCFTLHTNHCVTVYDQAMVDGVHWYMVREFSGTVGWIEADRLWWSPPQTHMTQKYVTLTKDRVWPRNMQFNRCAYYWPRDRRVLVRNHDAGHYETRYGGGIAYLRKEDCEDSGTAVVSLVEQRMAFLVGSETGHANSRYFDNAQGIWNAAFAESMAMAAGVSRSELPCTDEHEKAVIFWSTYPVTMRFYFWDEEIKRAYHERYPEATRITDAVTSTEKSQKPLIGRWLYFLTDEDRETGKLASYVGVVTAVTADQFTMVYVSPTTSKVTTVVFPAADRSAFGVAIPNYSYISAVKMT